MKMKTLGLSLATVTLISLASSTLGASEVPKSAPKAYPAGEVGKMVKLGEDILSHTNTHPLTKDLVGNKLQCTSTASTNSNKNGIVFASKKL